MNKEYFNHELESHYTLDLLWDFAIFYIVIRRIDL